MSKAGFSVADLQQGSKRLNNVEVVQHGDRKISAADEEALQSLGEY